MDDHFRNLLNIAAIECNVNIIFTQEQQLVLSRFAELVIKTNKEVDPDDGFISLKVLQQLRNSVEI